MARFIVHVKETALLMYEVEAESEEEALDNWADGAFIDHDWGLSNFEAVEVEKMEE